MKTINRGQQLLWENRKEYLETMFKKYPTVKKEILANEEEDFLIWAGWKYDAEFFWHGKEMISPKPQTL